MLKLFTMLTLLTSSIFAGGNIEPVRPITDPITNGGDALSITSSFILISITVIIGLYFIKKEQKHVV